MTPAASGAVAPTGIVQARISFGPAVKKLCNPSSPYASRAKVASAGSASPIDERTVQVDAIVLCAVARVGAERGDVEHRDQNDAAQHIGRIDIAQQMADGDGPFIFVAMVGAEADKPLASGGVRADHDGKRDEVITPDLVVLQRDVIVPLPG